MIWKAIRALGYLAVTALVFLPPGAGAVSEIPNPSQPVQPLQTMPLAELWRIGGAEDEDTLLGVVNKVLADAEGQLYLLDIQLTEIQVYDREGRYVRSLGQRGDGPGELRFVTDALFMPDGTVGLVQAFPGKIIKVDRAGVPAGEWKPGGDDPTQGGFFAIRKAAAVADHLVVSGLKITRGENSRTAVHFISQLDADGNPGLSFAERVNVREFGRRRLVEKDEFFPHENGWALAPDGGVVVAPQRNQYRLETFAADGTPLLVITREYESLPRTGAELERAEAMMMPWRRRNRSQIEFVMESTEPDIRQFHVADDGRIWVLPGRGVRDQAEGVHSTWDVFTPAGEFERQVAFACAGDGLQDTLFFPGGDLVVLVKEHQKALWAFQARGADDPEAAAGEGEASPLEVICYRIAPTLGRATD